MSFQIWLISSTCKHLKDKLLWLSYHGLYNEMSQDRSLWPLIVLYRFNLSFMCTIRKLVWRSLSQNLYIFVCRTAEGCLRVRGFPATLKTCWWPSAVVFSMIGLLSLWNIPHFHSQFYCMYLLKSKNIFLDDKFFY